MWIETKLHVYSEYREIDNLTNQECSAKLERLKHLLDYIEEQKRRVIGIYTSLDACILGNENNFTASLNIPTGYLNINNNQMPNSEELYLSGIENYSDLDLHCRLKVAEEVRKCGNADECLDVLQQLEASCDSRRRMNNSKDNKSTNIPLKRMSIFTYLMN
ncbi:MAG: hypothetical protein MHMPM18_004853 [Marteilia pararefringens]